MSRIASLHRHTLPVVERGDHVRLRVVQLNKQRGRRCASHRGIVACSGPGRDGIAAEGVEGAPRHDLTDLMNAGSQIVEVARTDGVVEVDERRRRRVAPAVRRPSGALFADELDHPQALCDLRHVAIVLVAIPESPAAHVVVLVAVVVVADSVAGEESVFVADFGLERLDVMGAVDPVDSRCAGACSHAQALPGLSFSLSPLHPRRPFVLGRTTPGAPAAGAPQRPDASRRLPHVVCYMVRRRRASLASIMAAPVCETTWEHIRRTPGRRKHLVIGNHDVTGEGEVRAQGFDGVWSVMTSAGEPPLLWTHYPLREVPEGHVNIHGHEHGRPRGGRRTSTSRSSSSSTSPSRSLGCGALRARSTADTTRRARRSSSGSPNSNAMPNDPEIVRTRVRVVSDLNVERQRPPPERVEKRQRESRAQTIRLPVETGAVDYAARDGAGARHMCYVPGEQPAALRDRPTGRLSSERAVVRRTDAGSRARDSGHGFVYRRAVAAVWDRSDCETSCPLAGGSGSRLLPPQGPRQVGARSAARACVRARIEVLSLRLRSRSRLRPFRNTCTQGSCIVTGSSTRVGAARRSARYVVPSTGGKSARTKSRRSENLW